MQGLVVTSSSISHPLKVVFFWQFLEKHISKRANEKYFQDIFLQMGTEKRKVAGKTSNHSISMELLWDLQDQRYMENSSSASLISI